MRFRPLPVLAAGVVALGFAAILAVCLPISRAAEPKPKAEPASHPDPKETPTGAPNEYPVPPPPFSADIFPCNDCHNAKDLPTNKTRRKLTAAHTDIALHHDEEHRWCLDCHNADNRDVLRSAAGDPIKFTESYKLCGQCHGDRYRDWRAGIHGKRTGEWNGTRQYLLCVHCHNPHSPRYKPLAPLPPPLKPAPSPW